MPHQSRSREVPVVDLRGLEPPEPLVRILQSLEGSGPWRFLLSREPLPLYGILKFDGWRYSVCRRPEGIEVAVEGPPAAGNKTS